MKRSKKWVVSFYRKTRTFEFMGRLSSFSLFSDILMAEAAKRYLIQESKALSLIVFWLKLKSGPSPNSQIRFSCMSLFVFDISTFLAQALINALLIVYSLM